eukprot:CAMPEP_0185028600 /NCGR_PEP_ID=MMETSP1103-20130426/14414_1 /TAXON_ID=36769 /ORGANISM="Paraphysomonas bandaiensis, Strain Caron Lab Isolate" /LENGTH=647 /DNA_ID=CAMNT_0027563065 /DNA_START=122 /DNA_END=2065 /DNA_ORIENTATION=-
MRGDIWDFEGTNSSEQIVYGHDTFGKFGISVSIWGDRMVIGAIGDHEDHGAAYVYERSSEGAVDWEQTAQISLEHGKEGDQFGYAVSIYRDTIVVGANLHDGAGDDSGAAYLYEYQPHNDQHAHAYRGNIRIMEGPEGDHDQRMNEWTMVLEMIPEDSTGQDYFGSSVGVYGNTTIVGCWGCDAMGSYSGAAYVYSKYFIFDEDGLHFRAYWGYHQKLIPVNGQRYDWFGTSVAIHGYGIVIGSSGSDNPTSSITKVGAAYVYVPSVDDSYADGLNWVLHTELFAGDGQHEDGFGTSVSIFDDIIVVGAPMATYGALESGVAYMFKRGDDKGWYFLEKLLPPRPVTKGHFGYSVDVYSDIAVVGSYNATGSGSVYVYGEEYDSADPTKTYWQQAFSFFPQNEIPGDKFGYAVSVDDTTIAVGAYDTSSEWVENGDDDAVAEIDGPPNQDLFMNGAVYVYWGGNRVRIRSESVQKTSNSLSTGGALALSLCGLMLVAYVVYYYSSLQAKKNQQREEEQQDVSTSSSVLYQGFDDFAKFFVSGINSGIRAMTSIVRRSSSHDEEEYQTAPEYSGHNAFLPSTRIDISMRSTTERPEIQGKDDAVRALDESLSKLSARRLDAESLSNSISIQKDSVSSDQATQLKTEPDA